MTRDDIIRMAREAGFTDASFCRWSAYTDDLERFAKLVYESVFRDANIAASATIIDAAVLAEREACAQLLDSNAEVCKDNSMLADVLAGSALAIRARGEE
jgi:hypothetical protein